MGASDLHNQIEVGMTEKVEMEQINQMAANLTNDLNIKAQEAAINANAQLRKLRVLKNANLVVGNRVDYLVNKFCTILKQRV